MDARRTLLVGVAAMLIAAGAATTGAPHAGAAQTAPTFTVVDLGLIKKTHGARGVGVSQNGKYAAVQSNWPTAPEHAASYHAGKLKAVGTFGGEDSFAYGIDNAGVLVGAARDSTQLERAFRYSAGTLTQLPDLGGDYSAAQAVNDHGLIVGTATTPINGGYDPRAVEWVNGQISVLPGLGTDSIAEADAVNEAGDTAGYSWTAQNSLPKHPVLWKAGSPIDLFPTEFVGGESYALNKQDAVVGGTCVQSSNPCTDGAWIWEDGVANSYLMATGGASGVANGINDHWMVVGRGTQPNGTWVPWVVFNGQRYDLNTLLAPGTTGWAITNPSQVNNLGDIIATANDTLTGQAHAVLLVPTSTPAWDTTKPTGTVQLDGGATSTASPTVPIVVTGSDASGIYAVRISNSSAVGSDHRLVQGVTVDPSKASPATPLSWNLTDPATGGSSAPGLHTVYVQWLDWAGNWSAPTSATITLT
jgi:probable HAF family extracellular repeat protein